MRARESEQRVDERRDGSASQEDQDPEAAEGHQDRQDPPLLFLLHEAEELPDDSPVRTSGLAGKVLENRSAVTRRIAHSSSSVSPKVARYVAGRAVGPVRRGR